MGSVPNITQSVKVKRLIVWYYIGNMDDLGFLPAKEQLPAKPPRFSTSKIMGWLGFAFVLFIIGGFSWRVFGIYRDIKSGDINPALAYTTNNFSRGLTALVAKAESSTEPTARLLGPSDASTGSASAKVIVVEFGDFGCPYSQEVAPIVRAIAKQYSSDVRFVYRNFPLEEIYPGATVAAQGGGCAKEQGKFWEYHDAIFASKSGISLDSITSIASTIGLNTNQFKRCIDSGYYAKAVAQDIADGTSLGVTGTPTFFFNGQKVEGSIPFTIFNQIIDALRKK